MSKPSSSQPNRSLDNPHAIDPAALAFFQCSIETPSPSGYEEPIQALIRDYITPHADKVHTDVHGNVIASRGDAAGPRLMYAGHCDQIGLLISHIDEQGFLYAQTIGGWDPQQLVGQSMTIWTGCGPVAAVISRKPIHLLSSKEREEVVQLGQMWLDIGVENQEQAKETVRVGDPVTLDLRYRPLMGDRVSGPGMDNKTGMWTVMESLRRCAAAPDPLRCHLHSVATVQEEIGLRGAKTAAGSINPDVAIAVDVTHASDCPTIEKNQQGDIRIGGGPVIFRGPNINAKVASRLIELAESHSIPYQLAAIGRATPNDANVLQLHGSGVATGLVAIPNRYMHSAVEVISLSDIDRIADLLSLFAQNLSSDDDFVPS
ncbi:putative aminopeptidase YsdC [Novipirellula aureliae]|uniref:Putative aminopeptidase YsdC n=1 Tax=Novipirellula aureliae TaxID=2527966 RepID=A0A5C6DH97_9BACT|nr:M42 family metallopeptidase [Novipirellula aureliae]TWU36703.1 putative aminopeptidase YsdC [Novipirellula aureliae]